MDTLRIQTSQNVEITVEAAGLGDRLIAAILDGLVQGAYLLVMSLVFGWTQNAWVGLAAVLPVLLYHLLFEVFFDGQSPGKRQMGIRVARLDGSSPSLGAYLIRWIVRPVEIWMTFGAAAMLTILLSRKGQRIGDLAAGTAVVRVRQDVALAETGLLESRPTEQRFPEASLLSSADVQAVHDVLRQYRARGRTARSERLVRRTKEVIEQKMGVPPVAEPAPAFLLQVLRDYHAAPLEE